MRQKTNEQLCFSLFCLHCPIIGLLMKTDLSGIPVFFIYSDIIFRIKISNLFIVDTEKGNLVNFQDICKNSSFLSLVYIWICRHHIFIVQTFAIFVIFAIFGHFCKILCTHFFVKVDYEIWKFVIFQIFSNISQPLIFLELDLLTELLLASYLIILFMFGVLSHQPAPYL